MKLFFLFLSLICLGLLGLLNGSLDDGSSSLPSPQYDLVSKEFTSMEMDQIYGNLWDMMKGRLYYFVCFMALERMLFKLSQKLQEYVFGAVYIIGYPSYLVAWVIYFLYWSSLKGIFVSILVLITLRSVKSIQAVDLAITYIGEILGIAILYYYSKSDVQKDNLAQTIKEDVLTLFSYPFWIYIMGLLKSVVLNFQGVIFVNVIFYTYALRKLRDFARFLIHLMNQIPQGFEMATDTQLNAFTDALIRGFTNAARQMPTLLIVLVFVAFYNTVRYLSTLKDDNGYSFNMIILLLQWSIVNLISSGIGALFAIIVGFVW